MQALHKSGNFQSHGVPKLKVEEIWKPLGPGALSGPKPHTIALIPRR